MEVKIVNKTQHELPTYATPSSAGMDLRADIQQPITLKPLERAIVKTGLFIELPVGYEAQVRPRSGLAAKHGVTVLNAPGTIDADYRGEIGVILVMLSNAPFTGVSGMSIAQLAIEANEHISWNEASVLSESDKETGGFGTTGTKKLYNNTPN